jgi:hypothetical protein
VQAGSGPRGAWARPTDFLILFSCPLWHNITTLQDECLPTVTTNVTSRRFSRNAIRTTDSEDMVVAPIEESYLGLEKASCIMEIVSIQRGARELAL